MGMRVNVGQEALVGRRNDGLHRNAFGVYRPLAPECADAVEVVMNAAAEEINDRLNDSSLRRKKDPYITQRKRKRSYVEPRKSYGATFLSRKGVHKDIKRRLLEIGNEDGLQRAAEALGRLVLSAGEGLGGQIEVPFKFEDWFSPRGRKFGPYFNFDRHQGAQSQLAQERAVFYEWMNELRTTPSQGNSPVGIPNHMTLLSCVAPRSANSLPYGGRDLALMVVTRRLARAGLDALVLDEPVVGLSYNEPHENFEGFSFAGWQPGPVQELPQTLSFRPPLFCQQVRFA